MLTTCQFKRLDYLSNTIFHGHIVPPLYFHPLYTPCIFDTGCGQYFFETMFHDLNKTLGTIEQDGIRGKLLTSSKH